MEKKKFCGRRNKKMAGCVTKSVRKSGGKAKKSKKELIKGKKVDLDIQTSIWTATDPFFLLSLRLSDFFSFDSGKKTFVYILFLVGQQLVAIRGGTSPTFSSLSRARALSIEPRWAQACQNFLQACFEPAAFPYKNYKIQAWACFKLFLKLCSSSLGPGVYLLWAKN